MENLHGIFERGAALRGRHETQASWFCCLRQAPMIANNHLKTDPVLRSIDEGMKVVFSCFLGRATKQRLAIGYLEFYSGTKSP